MRSWAIGHRWDAERGFHNSFRISRDRVAHLRTPTTSLDRTEFRAYIQNKIQFKCILYCQFNKRRYTDFVCFTLAIIQYNANLYGTFAEQRKLSWRWNLPINVASYIYSGLLSWTWFLYILNYSLFIKY